MNLSVFNMNNGNNSAQNNMNADIVMQNHNPFWNMQNNIGESRLRESDRLLIATKASVPTAKNLLTTN